MKLLKDLVLLRKELQDWDDVVTWSRNGTLYFNTTPEITIGKPIYKTEMDKNARELFHVTEYPLVLDNKLEYDIATNNSLINSQPNSYIRVCKPLRSSDENILAALTNNANIIIYKDETPIANLDQPNLNLANRIYHSFEWSPKENIIAVGNEAAELVFFKLDPSGNTFDVIGNITLGDQKNEWVTHLSWNDDVLIAGLSNNSVYSVKFGKSYHAEQLIEASRFKIFDINAANNRFVVISASAHFYRFDLVKKQKSVIDLPIGCNFYIVPLKNTYSILLVANMTTCRIDLEKNELSITPENIISPHLEHKFTNWNNLWNEFNKYETILSIYGVVLSPDGYSLAIVYNIERISLKYTIASERQYHIMFVPLCDEWQISNEASGLAWYQTYNIYKTAGLPLTDDLSEISIETIQKDFDTGLEFKEYLNKFFEDERINKLRFDNYITRDDDKCVNLFRRLIIRYAIDQKGKIDNLLDLACIESIAKVTSSKIDNILQNELVIRSEFIEQTFDFTEGTTDEIVSKEGNRWKRCSVTLLPLLSVNVKKCPVTGNRVIDIDKDTLNEYGWFTRALLDICSKKSVYSGTSMQ